ncbi:MAG TPA: hypothetical protein VFQ61_03430 [Polyangiaceae bacterium]|nr:hypothetical protein [Polyangiaceae bacterium]
MLCGLLVPAACAEDDAPGTAAAIAGNGGASQTTPTGGATSASSAGANSGGAGAGASSADASSADAGAAGTSQPGLEVVQVTTLTTVQASAGLALAPEPELQLPEFVERERAAQEQSSTGGLEDRAEIDTALVFRAAAGDVRGGALSVSPIFSAQRSWPVEWGFPALRADRGGLVWGLALSEPDDSTVSSDWLRTTEWTGWKAWGGLAVRAVDDDSNQAPGNPAPSAPAAILSFAARGVFSPLRLSSDARDLIISNPTNQTIAQALLIYSHSEGVGVREVLDLGPGERRETTLGPKEQPIAALLERARDTLKDFFVERLGEELGATIAESKSIPFLETPGLRLIYMLDAAASPIAMNFSSPVDRAAPVIVAHSEVLTPAEESRVLSLLARDAAPTLAETTSELGRFTQAKLEFAAQQDEPLVRERAEQLLHELLQP